jgi:hypothetical protein
LDASPEILRRILKEIDRLTKKDYTVKLSSILEPQERQYYTRENFKILKLAIKEKL